MLFHRLSSQYFFNPPKCLLAICYVCLVTLLPVIPVVGETIEVEFLTTIIDKHNQAKSISLEEGCDLNYNVCSIRHENEQNTWKAFEKNIVATCFQNKKFALMLLNFRQGSTTRNRDPVDNLQGILEKLHALKTQHLKMGKSEALALDSYDDLHYVALPDHLKELLIPDLFFSQKTIPIILIEEEGARWPLAIPAFCLREIPNKKETAYDQQALSLIIVLSFLSALGYKYKSLASNWQQSFDEKEGLADDTVA